MDDESKKNQFPKEFLGAFALTFFNEFNRIHHGASLWRALFTAFFTALLLAMEAHITRGKKKQTQWTFGGLFTLALAICFLFERQKMGPGAHWTEVLSNSFTIAIWVSAFFFLASYFWRQAEGEPE